MEFDALALILKQLYHKYLIPFFILDENNNILIPEHSDWTGDYLDHHYLNSAPEDIVHFSRNPTTFFVILSVSYPTMILVSIDRTMWHLRYKKSTFTFHDHDYLAGVHYAKRNPTSICWSLSKYFMPC